MRRLSGSLRTRRRAEFQSYSNRLEFRHEARRFWLTANPPRSRELYVPRLSPASLVSLETSYLSGTTLSFPDRQAARTTYLASLQASARDASDEERVKRMQSCATQWCVSETTAGLRLQCLRCRERMCTECQRVRAFKHTLAYTAYIESCPRPKFITLTLATSGNPVGETISRLYYCFQRLRRTAIWKACARGGYSVVEITPGKQQLGWHVHLHVIADADYMSQKALSEQWLRITGDSFRVHITAADSGTAKYLGKYLGKPASGVQPGLETWEMSDQLKGRRLAQGFGNAPALDLISEDAPDTIRVIGTLQEILDRAANGETHAALILDELREHYGSVPGERQPPPPPPDKDQLPLIE